MKHKLYNQKTFHGLHFMLHDRGFTIIELLVSIAVIGAVASFIFVNIGPRQTDLTRAAQKLALAVREAQNRSLAPLEPPPCIYGLSVMPPDRYFLYWDADCDTGYTYDPASSTKEPDVVLESGVSVLSAVDIAFEAPEPITYIGGLRDQSAIITLTAAGRSKTVRVNRFGQVEIQ